MQNLFFKASLLLVFCASQLQATFKEPAGWMWYLEKPIPEKQDEDNEKPRKELSSERPKFLTPQEQALKNLKKLQKEFEGRKALAVLNPTFENVQAVQKLQKQMVAQSTHFQKMWQLTALMAAQEPEDNPNPHHQRILKEEEGKALKVKLQKLSKSFGLFFMFKEDCPYCHRFSPIVRRFADEHGFAIKAISFNGGYIPEFPKSVSDNGAISKLNPEYVFPALFLVNPQTRDVIPLSWGMTSLSGLHENAKTILNHLEGRQ